jgi:hypothetical protein
VSGRGRKAALWESVMSDAMPHSIIYVSRELTQETRCTMRTLRLYRALFVVWGAKLPFGEVYAVGALLTTFQGSELVRQDDAERGPPLGSDRCQPGSWPAVGRGPRTRTVIAT